MKIGLDQMKIGLIRHLFGLDQMKIDLIRGGDIEYPSAVGLDRSKIGLIQ
jgi:hypothetical protein